MIVKTLNDFIKETGDYNNIFNLDYSFLDQFNDDDKKSVAFLIKHDYSDLILVNDIDTFTELQLITQQSLYNHKWNINRLNALYNKEYDPLSNYDKNSVITNEYGEKTGESITGEQSGTSSSNTTTTSTINESTSGTGNNSIYPFNATNDSTPTTGSIANTTTTGENGNVNNITGNTSTGERTDTYKDNTHTDKTTEQTSGNIGTTSSQDMWKWEKELLDKNNYYKDIAKIVISDITLPIF